MRSVKSKYYYELDLIRLIACIAIFLYHLNILKGGYLAVCVFLTLSGYLSCKSLLNKDKLSFKDYYLNRIKKLYIPLLVVTFISIFVITLFKNIIWFNLKPETTSVILGYNNFWQINVNLDYFAKHIDSPFMHLWYMGILLQFDLVFPFIYLFLKKIGDKIHKSISIIIPFVLSIISFIFFYKISKTNIMNAYYNTFTRVYSLLLGVGLAFINHYYKNYVINKKIISKIIFSIYITILILSFIFINVNSKYFIISMILSSIITLRLIDYGTLFNKSKLNIVDKIVKYLASISYEIYLVQYPVIFIFQNINMKYYFKVPIIILITIIISIIINYSLSIKKDEFKKKYLKIILLIITMLLSLIGLYKYITSKDYSKDIKDLENELSNNEKIMEERQKEVMRRKDSEEENWNNVLEDLEKAEKELDSYVKNLKIVGIGDSVMLNAINELYKVFPKGYFDAEVNRTEYELNGLLKKFKNNKILGDIIVINLGTNGECPQSCKNEFMKTIGNRQVFWVNATHPDFASFNPHIKAFAEKYDNVHLLDWVSACKGHTKEYLVHDGTHLTGAGRKAYAKFVYDSIYNYYLNELNKKKEEKVLEHEKEEKEKIMFIGNDLLLSTSKYLKDEFSNSIFVINKDYDYKTLLLDLNTKKDNKELSYNIVFVFDKKVDINYQELSSLLKDYKLYFVILDNNDKSNNYNYIDFSNYYNDYVMVDKIHLKDEGNKKLSELIIDELKNK